MPSNVPGAPLSPDAVAATSGTRSNGAPGDERIMTPTSFDVKPTSFARIA